MAVLPILVINEHEELLRRKAMKVKRIDGALQRLIEDLIETMRAAPGVGLAATQVGVPLKVAVIELPEEEPIALINPEIVKAAGEREVEEGCLSIPGYAGLIKRHVTVTVKARDRQGKAAHIKGEELLAQALEHEIDHLNGVLYIDHLESLDKLRKVEPSQPAREPTLAGTSDS